MDDIKFSVIMPFYNSKAYIDRAVKSVVSQSYSNWELIAINDGSFDDSLNIVKRYSNKDKRIKIYSKENGGYATAVNLGLNCLSLDSDYFLLLGSDDELENDLFAQVKRALTYKYDLVGFRTIIYFDETNFDYDRQSFINKSVKEKDLDLISFYKKHKELSGEYELFCVRDTSRLYKTSLLRKQRYLGKYGIASDGIFSMMFAYKCQSFAHLALDGYIWHMRHDSVSQKNSIDKIEDEFKNWIKFFSYIKSNNFEITNTIKYKYLDRFLKCCLQIIISNKEIYKSNIANIKKANKLLDYFSKKYEFKYERKANLIRKHFQLYRLYYLLKNLFRV